MSPWPSPANLVPPVHLIPTPLSLPHLLQLLESSSKATPPWPCSKGEKSPACCPVPGNQGGAESCGSSNYFFFLAFSHFCFSCDYHPLLDHCTSDHTVHHMSCYHFCTSCGFFSLPHPTRDSLILKFPCCSHNSFKGLPLLWTSIWTNSPLHLERCDGGRG